MTRSFDVFFDLCLNKRLGKQERPAGDIFKCILINETFCISIWISLKFVPRRPIDNRPALVHVMAWRRTNGGGGRLEVSNGYCREMRNSKSMGSENILELRLFFTPTYWKVQTLTQKCEQVWRIFDDILKEYYEKHIFVYSQISSVSTVLTRYSLHCIPQVSYRNITVKATIFENYLYFEKKTQLFKGILHQIYELYWAALCPHMPTHAK